MNTESSYQPIEASRDAAEGSSAPQLQQPVIVVLGQTAVGKTEFSLGLAEAVGGEILNADALQVYRGLEIGTAKPTPEQRQRVPHHLIDILDPTERYSAGDFARRARQVIRDLEARGRRAVVVGGSGLYLRALLEGISPIPPGDPKVRQQLRDQLDEVGVAQLYARLRQTDPLTAERLGATDTQRILRALEVFHVSGRPLSSWIAERPFGEKRLPAIRFGLTLPRDLLYHRIEARVETMVHAGWVDEVRRLLASGLSPDAPAFQAIGYRQLVRHLRGEWPLDQALTHIVRETRRFAKRQETWFRREPDVAWLPAQDAAHRLPDLVCRIREADSLV